QSHTNLTPHTSYPTLIPNLIPTLIPHLTPHTNPTPLPAVPAARRPVAPADGADDPRSRIRDARPAELAVPLHRRAAAAEEPAPTLGQPPDLAQSPFYAELGAGCETSATPAGGKLFEALAARRLDPAAFATEDDRRLRFAPQKRPPAGSSNGQRKQQQQQKQQKRRRSRRRQKRRQADGEATASTASSSESAASSGSEAGDGSDRGSSFESVRLPAAYRQSQL
ncbi:hypothetical protein BOX15_Mlig009969g2, partial [Macrostomum lignano]